MAKSCKITISLGKIDKINYVYGKSPRVGGNQRFLGPFSTTNRSMTIRYTDVAHGLGFEGC